MSEREFAYYSLEPKAQAKAHIARLGGDQWWKDHSSCNCAEATKTPHFNPPGGKKNVAKSGVEKSDKSEGEKLYPSKEPPLIPEYYAACHVSEFMPDVVDIDNPIQGMLSHAAMMSSAGPLTYFGLRMHPVSGFRTP